MNSLLVKEPLLHPQLDFKTSLDTSNFPVSSMRLINTSPNADMGVKSPPCLASAVRLGMLLQLGFPSPGREAEAKGSRIASAASATITSRKLLSSELCTLFEYAYQRWKNTLDPFVL